MKRRDKRVSAVVLAAGKSTRIKSSTPKVIMELGGQPLIFYVLRTLTSLKAYLKQIIVVHGHKKELIKAVISNEFKNIDFVYQKKLNGTAKAVESALSAIKEDNVLIVCADTPLIERNTLNNFVQSYFKENTVVSFITGRIKEENDLGRVARDSKGQVIKIIEKQDLTYDLDEVNSGICCFKKDYLLKGLRKIKMNIKKKEYFLTDIIEIFSKQGLKISTYNLSDWRQITGINTQKAFSLAYNILNDKLLEKVMSRGVKVVDPGSTFLSYDTKIGENSVIYPFTFIEKNVIIGNNCFIGPFVHLRKDVVIENNSSVRNFADISRSSLKKKSKKG